MKLYKSLIIAAAMVTSAQSATVSLDMGADVLAATLQGAPVGNGYTMYLGRYTGGALASTATYSQIITAGFIALPGGSATYSSGPAAGYIGIPDTAYAAGSGFENQPLYVLITNGSDANALITGLGNMLPDNAIPNALAVAIDASNAPTLTYAVGSYSSAVNTANGGAVILNGPPAVPEPSAALLGAVGALGLLRRRRN